MPRKESLPRPTDGELEILQVLWQQGPSTVRQVHAALEAAKPVGLTTVLKLLQIMFTKGLVDRDETERTHVYRPRVPAEKTRRQLATDLIQRAFEGSAQKLIMQALSAQKVSSEELAEIRATLEDLERRTP